LGIIYMNLVKIIYMAIIVLICLIKIMRKKSILKKYKGGEQQLNKIYKNL
jgi:hypothetical protein